MEPTLTAPHPLTSSTASGVYLYGDTAPLNHVDILWLVTSLLLSLLCIILVVLTYYVFKSRVSEDYAPPAEMVKRMHSQSVSKLRSSPSNSVRSHRKHTGSHSNNLNMVMAEDLNQHRYPFHLPPPAHRHRQHSVHPHISDEDTGSNSMYLMSPREEGSDVYVPRHDAQRQQFGSNSNGVSGNGATTRSPLHPSVALQLQHQHQ